MPDAGYYHTQPGQLAFPALIPSSFWVTTQGHKVIADGSRFLVIEKSIDTWWLAWENGIAPLGGGGTLLKECQFHREETKT